MGTAPNLKFYAANVDTIVGIDFNAAMQPFALESAAQAGVEASKLQLVVGKAEALPLPDACVDAVIATHVSCKAVHGVGTGAAKLVVTALRHDAEKGTEFDYLAYEAPAAPQTTTFADAVAALPSSLPLVPFVLQLFCSVEDVPRSLSEILRVLKPGGRYIFLEHVAAGPHSPRLRCVQCWLTPAWSVLADGCCLNRDTLAQIEAAGFSKVEAEHLDIQLPWLGRILGPHVAGVAFK